MGLATRANINLYSFCNGIVYPEPLVPLIGGATVRYSLYYDRLDRVYCRAHNSGGTIQNWGWLDPLWLDPTQPATHFDLGVTGTDFGTLAGVGEWNKSAGTQALYSWDGTTGTAKLQSRDPQTLQLVDVDPFPNVRLACSQVASGTDGYYYVTGNRYVLIFETQGYLFCPFGYTYQNGSTYYNPCAFYVDLSSGLASPPDPGFYARSESAPHEYEDPQVHGENVDWSHCQFVPDDDSTHQQPKGFLWWMQQTRAVGGVPNANQYQWARKVEWNPTGVSGTPSRTHGRIILTSRIEYDETIVDSGAGVQHSYCPAIYHAASDQIWTKQGIYANPADPDHTWLTKFATVPGVDSITAASWTKIPQTAATIPFFVEVLGTLGEPVAGVDVSWTIERVSEVDERFDGNVVGVGGTYTLDEGPADSGTIVVIEDPDGAATVLTETTDYTVNGPRTQITGAGGKWDTTKWYAVYYEHKATALSPAHGTLLESSSQSDINGQATCRVRYPDDDDLVGAYEQLSAEAT